MAIKRVFSSILLLICVGLASGAHVHAMDSAAEKKTRRSLSSAFKTPPPSPDASASSSNSPFVHSSASLGTLDTSFGSANTSSGSLETTLLCSFSPQQQASPPLPQQPGYAGQDDHLDDDAAPDDDGANDGAVAKSNSWVLPEPSPASPFLGVQQGSIQNTPSPDRKTRLNAIPLNHLFYSFIKNVLTFSDENSPIYAFISALFDLQNPDVFGQTRVAIKVLDLNGDFEPRNDNYPIRELCLFLQFWDDSTFTFIKHHLGEAIDSGKEQLNQQEIRQVVTHFFESTKQPANRGQSYKDRSKLPNTLKNVISAFVKCLQSDKQNKTLNNSLEKIAQIAFAFYRTKLIELLEPQIDTALLANRQIKLWPWVQWHMVKDQHLSFAEFFHVNSAVETPRKEMLSRIITEAKLSDLLHFNFQDIQHLPALVRGILRTSQEEEAEFINSQVAYTPSTPATAAAFMEEARAEREIYFRYIRRFEYYTNSAFKEISDQIFPIGTLRSEERPLLLALIQTFKEVCKHVDSSLNLYSTSLLCLINFAKQFIVFARDLTARNILSRGPLADLCEELETISQNTQFNDATCLQCDHLLDLVRSQSEVAARQGSKNLEITFKGGHVFRADQYFIRNALSTQGAYCSGLAVIDTVPATRYPSPAGVHQNLLVIKQAQSHKVISKSIFPVCYNSKIYQYIHNLLGFINSVRNHAALPDGVRCYQELASKLLSHGKEVKRVFVIEHPHSLGCDGNECTCQPDAPMRSMLCMVEPTEFGKNEQQTLIPLVITVFPYGIRHFHDQAELDLLQEPDITFKAYENNAIVEKIRTIADIRVKVGEVRERLCRTSALDCKPRDHYSGTMVCDMLRPQKWYLLCDLPELAWQVQMPAFDLEAMDNLVAFINSLCQSLHRLRINEGDLNFVEMQQQLLRLKDAAEEACPLSHIPGMVTQLLEAETGYHPLMLTNDLEEKTQEIAAAIHKLHKQVHQRFYDEIVCR